MGLPEVEASRVYTINVPTAIQQGETMTIMVQLKMPKAEDQLYVTMPPAVDPAVGTFAALLADGRELIITPPPGLGRGEQMLITIPTASESDRIVKAPKEPKEKKKKERAEGVSGGARAAATRARQALYGITYKHIEQFIVARYGSCINNRLMGSLASAIRSGRMQREGGKIYIPTGTMLAPNTQGDLEKLTSAQRAALRAEEKRNKKLAKQQFLSGKARRRQELDDKRLAHNRSVMIALRLGELERNAYIQNQIELLGPFVRGAKKSLQAALGPAPGSAMAMRREPCSMSHQA